MRRLSVRRRRLASSESLMIIVCGLDVQRIQLLLILRQEEYVESGNRGRSKHLGRLRWPACWVQLSLVLFIPVFSLARSQNVGKVRNKAVTKTV